MADSIVRNFSIIAHIDHGKTTLTDRLLLKTGTISERVFTERMMDSNPIEQERGITIKMAPVRMDFEHHGQPVSFNLIDTPGHVDFSYEVSRSLAAVEGALLLVDATQGIQAQTLSHFDKTQGHDLKIIPVINKIDLPNLNLETIQLEMMEAFGVEEDDFVFVSAKTGIGIDELIDAIISKMPGPKQNIQHPLKALIFNSFYEDHKGAIAAVRLIDGQISARETLHIMATNTLVEPVEIGIFAPNMKPVTTLKAGDVGYIATGLKDIRLCRVGDTITQHPRPANIIALPGYNPPQLMVFLDFYPLDGAQYSDLTDAMDKLSLNDAAIQYTPVHSQALGNGLRVGLLGILHAEIVQERLEREFDIGLIATAPSVKYELIKTDGAIQIITNPIELPEPNEIKEIHEPIAHTSIYTPKAYVGAVMQLCEDHRGNLMEMDYFGDRTKLIYDIPLAEIIVTFFDELKSISSGYASIEYHISKYAPVDAVKLAILINHEPIEALSQIVVRSKAEQVGRRVAKVLSEVIPRQLFVIPIQAAIGGKIVARETVKAFRKDVTAKLYGGDITRRKKLLEKQKKGKSRRKQFGKVEIPQEAFMAVLKKE